MSFVVPLALAWSALAIPIVIFYILKIRLRRVPVSTTIFWQQIFDEKKPRSIWQRLRHLISLLVQILLLLLLVFALADPFLPWEILEARRLVLVVDNSASMRAMDGSPTRLDAARDLGLDAIARLRLRDEMAVVSAGSQPRVVCGLTGHQRTLRESLGDVPATDGPTRVEDGIALARRLIGDHPRGRVIVLSDGCFEDAGKLAENEDVVLRRVGERTGNVGITQFQVRRSLIDPLGYEILVQVTNASEEAVECRLEIDLDEFPVDVLPLTLAPGEAWSQTLEKTSEEGGRLIARLNHDDAFATDNEAVALLPERERQKVLVVTKGNVFLQMAFAANQLVDLSVVNELPDAYEEDTIVVFHGDAPEQLPTCHVLVVDPANSTDVYEIGDLLENPIVTEQDDEADLMRHVRLDNIVMPEARQLTIIGEPEVLVEALGGNPLYAALDRPSGKLLVLTVNLDKGDLTFRTAFPIIVTNALGWFAGESGELREALSTGSLTEIELPTTAASDERDDFFLRAPSGDDRQLPAGIAKTTIGPLDERGVWSVMPGLATEPESGAATPGVAHADESTVEEPVLQLACNLANRAESDLRMAEALFDLKPPADLASGWLTKPIWFYLIGFAWLLAAIEWFLYQRRWIS